jgi:Protein of unknown function (DUF3617)
MKRVGRICKLALCAVAVVAASSAIAHAADRPNITPGNWEITITMEMPGMPTMPAMTSTHCVKADHVKDGQSFAAQMAQMGQKRNGKCSVSDLKFDGAHLLYSYSCENGASGTTELAFSGTTYEGTSKTNMPAKDNHDAMTIVQHYKAKRIGDC